VNTAPDVYGYAKVKRSGAADRRHRLVTSGMVQMPADILVSAILDLRSALRMDPTTSLDLDNDGYTGDLPSGVMPGSGCRGINMDAVNAFRTSRNLAPVNSIQCPGFSNLDLRVSKSFAFGGQRLEIIGQLFNVFNTANYAAATTNLTSTLFGQSTTLQSNINAPSRQAEFAIRYHF
jgi:hypothetical protein